MQIRSIANGGVAEVDAEYGERLIEGGHWEALDAPAKPKRTRRTKAQIAADNAAATAESIANNAIRLDEVLTGPKE